MTDKPARPWDFFNKNVDRVSLEIYEKRMSICQSCPELIKTTKQCKICLCIMPAKARLPHADCPIGKWGKEIIPLDKEVK